MRGIAKQKDGKETPITLTNIKYVPQLFCNLISLSSVLDKGFKINENGNENGMTIRKGNTEYIFDQRIKSGEGELAGIRIDIWDVETASVCMGCTHAILGHTCKQITNLTAKFLDLNKIVHEKIAKVVVKENNVRKTSRKRWNLRPKNRAIESTSI